MLKFGAALVGAGIAGIFLGNSEKGILSGFLSVGALAFYTVAFTLGNMATLFSTAMIQSLIPAFSQLTGSAPATERLYRAGLRLNLLLLIPIIGVLFVVARPFFTIWAGPEYGIQSSPAFYILLCGLIFNLPGYLPYSVIMSAGRSDIVAKLYFFEIIPYLAVTVLLVSWLGIIGAAIAWSARAAFDGVLFFGFADRISDADLSFGRSEVRGICLLGAAYLCLIALATFTFDRPEIAVAFGFVLSAGLMLLVWSRILKTEEKQYILAKLGWLTAMPRGE
jgi:O-antigen/teichoic acid export membrane protein